MAENRASGLTPFSKWVQFFRMIVAVIVLCAGVYQWTVVGFKTKPTPKVQERKPKLTSSTNAPKDIVYHLKKRKTELDPALDENGQKRYRRSEQVAQWDPKKTAVIVCGVWDYHHSLTAVRRLEEMLPQMNSLLATTRRAGSIIIHSPSDCMPFYETHPGRTRALELPKENLPLRIASWNCRIDQEVGQLYPLDQTDGGDDHELERRDWWSKQLEKLGRNPNLPWKSQNDALRIDPGVDYISDQGDEVWAILKHHQIEHVLMIGVHTNMCVIGRPFGLRQLVENDMDVVLVRDLTDCMYNPAAWPYVDHYSGNDLMIAYIEQVICPTITSDQVTRGGPVVFTKDERPKKDLLPHEILPQVPQQKGWEMVEWQAFSERWFGTNLDREDSLKPEVASNGGSNEPALRNAIFLRCSLRIPPEAFANEVTLFHPKIRNAWLNGNALQRSATPTRVDHFEIVSKQTYGNDDTNLLVVEMDISNRSQIPIGKETRQSPIVFAGDRIETLNQTWQQKLDPQERDSNLPLPAKFALPPAVYYTLP
jgi:nicotinamidase-related amidase